jgi:hypothetical protein
MALVAAGPAVRVPEVLYRRIDQRTGGLTDGWRRLPFERFVEGCRYNVTMAREVIDGLLPTAEERVLLEFGLTVYMTRQLRRLERTHAAPTVTAIESVMGSDEGLRLPTTVDQLPDELAEQCRDALRRAKRLTAERVAHVEQLGST